MDALPACEVRAVIEPIAERLGVLLSGLSLPLDVVFEVGDDGQAAVVLRGDLLAVNQARDVVGSVRAVVSRS